MVSSSGEQSNGETGTAVIARDPNMSVSTISMGETKMLECHYKFGVYDEPLPEPEEPTSTDIEQDSSDQSSTTTATSSRYTTDQKRSNSIQFGFGNRKKKKKKPEFEPTPIETIDETEEKPTSTSELQYDSDGSGSYTVDCTGTTGVRINVDTSEMKRKMAEKRENFRKSLPFSSISSESDQKPRSFEAGLKLSVRPKTEEELHDKIREDERMEAVRNQQKDEIFRLNEKTTEWVPPEISNINEGRNNNENQTTHDTDCMQSFCLYLKIQLSQFSHFSVRTVSPEFDPEGNEADRHVSVEEEIEQPESVEEEIEQPESVEEEIEQPESDIPPPPSPPPVRQRIKQSTNSKQKKRRDSGVTFGFGTKRSKKKLGGSISPVVSDVEGEIQANLETDEKKDEKNNEEQSDSNVDADTTSSINFVEEFWETTKEAYGVQKAGAEIAIDATRKEVIDGTSTVVDKTIEIKDRTLERTKIAANEAYEKTVEIGDATLQKTKEGATAVVDKTVESANVVVDKTVELANKTVEVVDDASKDIPVHPFGRGRNSSGDKEVDYQEKEDTSVDNKEELPANESEMIKEDDVKDLPDNVHEPAKPQKKKRRKSSALAFGFGNKNKRKNSTKKIEKQLSESSRTSSRTSLKIDTVPEMAVVEEIDEPLSEKSELSSHKSETKNETKPDGKSVSSVDSVSSKSSHFIESFIVTTKEAFGTTKSGAEKVIDKSIEIKNTLFAREESDKTQESPHEKGEVFQESSVVDDVPDDEDTIPTGDAHLQRLWRTITRNKILESEQESDSEEWRVLNDYENLPRADHQYGHNNDGSQFYTVPESRYNEIIEPPRSPPPASSSTSSSSDPQEPDDHIYMNVREGEQERNQRWTFWKKEPSQATTKSQPQSPTNNKGWVDY